MRWFSLSIVLLFAVLSGSAQTCLVKGKIVDAKTKAPLPEVNVVILDSTGGVVSDADGQYQISVMPPSSTLHFRYIGYRDSFVTVSCSPGDTLSIHAELGTKNEQLNAVVVSATRYKQKLADITVSMEVIKPTLIEARNTLSLDESLQQVPGVIIVDDEPQIRSGSGYSFGAGSRVMVMLDGLPVLSGDIGRPTWDFMPVENVEQVEVIKGASSVLYGSGALSGVINLRTAFPRDEPETRVSVYGGVYSAPQTDDALYWMQDGYRHSQAGFGDISETIDNPLLGGFSAFHSQKIGKLDVVVAANGLADMGHVGPYYHENASGQPVNFTVNQYGDTLFNNGQSYKKRLRANANFRYRFSDRVNAGVNVNALTAEKSGAFIWFNNDSGLYRPFNGSLTRTVQHAITVDPHFEYRAPDGLQHSLNGRWYHLNNDNTNNQGNESDTFYGEYKLQHQFDGYFLPGLRITGGAVASYTNSCAELYSAQPGMKGENEASNLAFYTDVGYEFFDFLKANAGVRYESYKVNGFEQDATIFRSGVSAQLARATYLRASYGQGYRFPTIGERYIRTTVGTYYIFPNNNLQPESSYNAELGLRQGFRLGETEGYVDVAGFYQHYKDFIEFTFGAWGSQPDSSIDSPAELLEVIGFRSVNTGESTVKGIDATVGISLSQRVWKLDAQIGYTYTLPQTQNANTVYAMQSNLVTDREVTYANVSSDPSNRILKYRFQHLVKGNLDIRYRDVTVGASLRYNSFMQNIDNAFLKFDKPGLIPTGLTEWRQKNNEGDVVVDLRLSYKITPHSTVAVVMNNAFNREYALRPLAIEKPRTTLIRYTYHI